MTTPRVTEMPRRLEPISADTFLGGCGSEARPASPPASLRESRQLAAVVQLRPRDPLAARRTQRARRARRSALPASFFGPGGDSAA